MTKMTHNLTPLTDYRLAAGAVALGGRLERVDQDPASGRLTFFFEGLSPTFVHDAFNGDLTVNLLAFLNALEQMNMLIAQYKARRRQ